MAKQKHKHNKRNKATAARTAARHSGQRQRPWPHEYYPLIAGYHSVNDPDNDGDNDASDTDTGTAT